MLRVPLPKNLYLLGVPPIESPSNTMESSPKIAESAVGDQGRILGRRAIEEDLWYLLSSVC